MTQWEIFECFCGMSQKFMTKPVPFFAWFSFDGPAPEVRGAASFGWFERTTTIAGRPLATPEELGAFSPKFLLTSSKETLLLYKCSR